MPRPTAATTLQRPDLGAIAYEYELEASRRGFIGLVIMPFKEVPEQSADYPKIPIEALLKLKDTRRAPRANYGRSDWEFKTDTYACKEDGWEEVLDDSEARSYKRYFDAEEVCVKICVDAILRRQEKRIADLVFNESYVPKAADIAIPWNTIATATPRANVNTAKEYMRSHYGLKPNVIAMTLTVLNQLLLTTEIISAFRYTNPIEIGGFEAQKRLVAQYFGVDQCLVGDAQYDTAKKGQAYSLGEIWDDEYIGLYKINPGDENLRDSCIGRTFLWTADSPTNLVTEQYREEQKRSNVYRTRHNTDSCLVFAGAGVLLGNIIHP